MFALVIFFVLPTLGMSGHAVIDQRFETRAACEAAAPDEVERAVSHLTSTHGPVEVQWVKCMPEELLKPGADA